MVLTFQIQKNCQNHLDSFAIQAIQTGYIIICFHSKLFQKIQEISIEKIRTKPSQKNENRSEFMFLSGQAIQQMRIKHSSLIFNIKILLLTYNLSYLLIQQKLAIIILSIAIFMKLSDTPKTKPSNDDSNKKSSRPTLQMSNSPLPIHEESSMLSLNFEDLKELMRRKEKQYQNGLQIADAKNVHGFLSQLQAKQKQKAKAAAMAAKRKLQLATERYNNQALIRSQAEWKANLEHTLAQLEEVGRLAQKQQQNELKQAYKKLEDAENGKGLQQARFSKSVLQMEDQLTRLVKAQRYEEAEVVNRMLQQKKKQQVKQLLQESVEREKRAIHQLKKRHNMEKEKLRQRLEHVYSVQEARRDQSIGKLVKNIRTYEIDPNKLTFSVQRHLRGTQSRHRTQSVSIFETAVKENEEKQILRQS